MGGGGGGAAASAAGSGSSLPHATRPSAARRERKRRRASCRPAERWLRLNARAIVMAVSRLSICRRSLHRDAGSTAELASCGAQPESGRGRRRCDGVRPSSVALQRQDRPTSPSVLTSASGTVEFGGIGIWPQTPAPPFLTFGDSLASAPPRPCTWRRRPCRPGRPASCPRHGRRGSCTSCSSSSTFCAACRRCERPRRTPPITMADNELLH